MNPSSSGSNLHNNEDITMGSQSQAGQQSEGIPRTHQPTSSKKRREKVVELTVEDLQVDVADATISMDAFKNLTSIDLVQLPIFDTDHNLYYHYIFSRGDNIKVNSADDKTGTNNTWVCKIFDIRADTEMKRVWFYIAWYYSTNDIIRYIAGRYPENDDGSPTTPISVYHQYLVDHLPAQTTSFDRFLSNHTELLLANVTQGHTTVYRYEECSGSSPEFEPDEYYSRGDFNVESMEITPKWTDSMCRLCQDKTYIPFPVSENKTNSGDKAPDSAAQPDPREPWRFCPGCGKWYHQRCLEAKSLDMEINMIGPPCIRRFAVDTRSSSPPSHPAFAPYTYPVPSQGESSSVTAEEGNPWDGVLERLKHLPPGLVKMAQQPIIKYPGVDSKMSVMGNLKDVMIARLICDQELEGGVNGYESDEYEEMEVEMEIEMETEDKQRGKSKKKEKGKGKQRAESSPKRRDTTRINASPFAPYWELEKLSKHFHDDAVSVLCSRCKAVI